MKLFCKLFGCNYTKKHLTHRYLLLKCSRCQKPLSIGQKVAIFTLEKAPWPVLSKV